MKTVKFHTLGCKVNQYDTQSIREQFIRAGFKEIDNGKKADIYVINTCTVTQSADSESFNLIRRAKKENPQGKIIVTGCLSELDNRKISQVSASALIVQNRDKNRILDLLNRPTDNREPITENRGISYFKNHTRAFLKIQDGCNNFCSYCKVPLVRGVSRSRPLNDIIREAEELAKNGFKELVLCGICLGAYGKDLVNNLCGFDKNSCRFVPKDSLNLIDVIDALEKIKGLLRIRLSSIELGDISDELIDKMSRSQKLCRHLHIPLQSGDDEILKKMNRRYCRQDYLRLIRRIKTRIPALAITTDVMVGFPGESERNFKNTLDLIKKVSPLKVHIFPYSKRAGTPAANFKEEVKPFIVKERVLRLKRLSEESAAIYKKQFIGKTLDALIEGRLKENPKIWEGYTDNYIKVRFESNYDLKNRLIPVRVEKLDKDFCRVGI